MVGGLGWIGLMKLGLGILGLRQAGVRARAKLRVLSKSRITSPQTC